MGRWIRRDEGYMGKTLVCPLEGCKLPDRLEKDIARPSWETGCSSRIFLIRESHHESSESILANMPSFLSPELSDRRTEKKVSLPLPCRDRDV